MMMVMMMMMMIIIIIIIQAKITETPKYVKNKSNNENG